MKLQTHINDNYGADFQEITTGGNCAAISGDINTNQDQLIITDGNSCIPTMDSEHIELSVFLNGEYGEPAFTIIANDVEDMDSKLFNIFALWGY